ncbi:MAG: 16S rRNA (guanine(966)-N(2))-methyltransferase RsmD, partial [Candidatus ainarchaeum sp.]|nr:16S rRNA (guanine(966)-N(2))-methyltransferase RsmD [Candidatus ainarchaeum sp.]
PPTHDIRPTTDKVKQALFTRLQFFIENSRVLDLFCGSGAVGIEAISRGARKVVFCDNNEKSILLTKKNINSLKLEKCKTIIEINKIDYLQYLARTSDKFDLIILDPPYNSDHYVPALKIIKDRNLLAESGIIVCERLKTKMIEQNYFVLSSTKTYGTIALDYLEN